MTATDASSAPDPVEDLFRQVFRASPLPAALVALSGSILDANVALANLLGFALGEAPAGSLFATLVSFQRAAWREAFAAAERGDPIDLVVDARLQGGDGLTVPTRATRTLLRGADNAPVAMLVQFEDVGHDQGAEEASARLARAGTQLLCAVTDGVYQVDLAGRIVFANPAAGRLLGWPVPEMLGRPEQEVVFGDPRANPTAVREKSLRLGETRSDDDLFLRRDGRPLPVRVTSVPMFAQDRLTGTLCVISDITDLCRDEFERSLTARWERRISAAIREERLVAFAQPIVDLQAGVLVMDELLVRMRGEHPAQLLHPHAFVPQAERHGQIGQIDRWMFDTALATATHGRAVSVNLSARSLLDSELVAHILEAVAHQALETALNPTLLTFELTETAAIEQMAAAVDFAERLGEIGCRFMLDDFGTGYSRLSYLKSIPAAYVKIDADFVSGVLSCESDRRIVKTIVAMAKLFGKQTVAEGVENAATVDWLRDNSVDLAQGYHIAPPRRLVLP